VTTETTAPPASPISGQRAAVQALMDLVDQHEQLPDAYITIHAPLVGVPVRLDMQLDTPHDFEQWRSALAVRAADVKLHTTTSNTWLSADTTHQGVTVHLSGFYVRLTAEQLNAPRGTSEVAA
jgi:hypothetical protein